MNLTKNLKKQLEQAASPDGPCTGMDDEGMAFYCAVLALKRAEEIVRKAIVCSHEAADTRDEIAMTIRKEREKL